MLDADEAGEASTQKHAHTLHSMHPHVHITYTILPAGEDVNSVLQNHDDAKVLIDLIESRKDFSFSTEKRNAEIINSVVHKAPPLESLSRQSGRLGRLDTTNPELLIYDNCELYFEILSGIKITGLDRMKVTLSIYDFPYGYVIRFYVMPV